MGSADASTRVPIAPLSWRCHIPSWGGVIDDIPQVALRESGGLSPEDGMSWERVRSGELSSLWRSWPWRVPPHLSGGPGASHRAHLIISDFVSVTGWGVLSHYGSLCINKLLSTLYLRLFC